MTYTFNTAKRPCALELVMQSNQPREIYVTGYDTGNQDPYFTRICQLEPGRRHTFYCGMPISPKQLRVQIFDQNDRIFNRQNFLVSQPRLVGLKTLQISLDQYTADFLKFAEYMAVNMPYLQTGKNYRLDNRFEIRLYHDLETSTPARIHSTENFIEVSKSDFLKMTIPRRIIILLHEYAHNYLNNNPENESEADINALTIYLARGYPFMEAVYAFTKILYDNDQSVQRLVWMDEFMKRHQLYIDK